MEIVTTFLSFMLVMTILVFVHEFGHYWAAKKVGVKIEIFSIGFGKEIFGFTDKSGTRWKFSILPLGGYVKMYGDKNAASQYDKELTLNEKQKLYSLHHKSLSQKSFVIAAGPLANYIFAILIFTFLFFSYGKAVNEPIIHNFTNDSTALAAGLKIGDKITSINDKKIDDFSDLVKVMELNIGEEIKITIARENNIITKYIKPKPYEAHDITGKEVKVYRLGIIPRDYKIEKQSIFSSIKLSVNESIRLSTSSLKAIWQIISGQRSVKDLGGPVKIAQYSSKTAQYGFISLISFIAIMSVNLGLINLLPIPALDGGHLLINLVEFIFGKKIAVKFQDFGFQIGLILLIIMTLVVTYNDVMSLNIFSQKVLK